MNQSNVTYVQYCSVSISLFPGPLLLLWARSFFFIIAPFVKRAHGNRYSSAQQKSTYRTFWGFLFEFSYLLVVLIRLPYVLLREVLNVTYGSVACVDFFIRAVHYLTSLGGHAPYYLICSLFLFFG